MGVPVISNVSLLAKVFFFSWCPAVSPYRRGRGAWGSTEALGIGHVLPAHSFLCCEPAGECRALRASEEEARDRLLLPYQNTWVVYKGKLFIWPAVSEACKATVRSLSGHMDAMTAVGACAEEITRWNRKQRELGSASPHSPLLRVGPGAISHQVSAHKYTTPQMVQIWGPSF